MSKIPVLVICDDFWHPAEVIVRGMQGMEQDEYAFDFVFDAKDMLTPAMIRRYPMIINCKCNNINAANDHEWFQPNVTEVMPDEILRYIEEGHGFLAVHSGLAFFEKDTSGMLDINGSFFIRHPDRCDVTLNVVKPEHPVTKGIETFVTRDEHYEIGMICDDADVFLRSMSETGGNQVAGYSRLFGDGRFCALTPGHILDVWENPMFRKLLLNAMAWCLKMRQCSARFKTIWR